MSDIKIKVIIDGVRYKPVTTGFGAQLISYEKNLKVGDTRFIANQLMHVRAIYKRKWFGKPEINWCLCSKSFTIEKIREFHKEILKLE